MSKLGSIYLYLHFAVNFLLTYYILFVQKLKSNYKGGIFYDFSAQLFEKSETLTKKIFASCQSGILITEYQGKRFR